MDQNPPKESRPPINLRIKFRSETLDQFIERYAVDVSRGGIFIRTREPLAVGTQLKLDFQFQSGNPLMSGEGTVVWIRELDPNRTSVPPGMGVRFDKLTPDSQVVLEQLLTEKGKRERGGIPGSNAGGAGGMAVRRPSSLFAVLDPRAAAEASAAAAAVKGSTFSGNAAASEGSTAAAPPISESARRDAANAKQDTPGYRPLGNARNPFSSASPSLSPSGGNDPGTPSHTEPVGSSPVAMKPLAGLAPVAKPNPFPAQRRPTPVDNAAPFDDISDEPTQIAGRLPSFLTTDEEETAVVRPFSAAPFAGAQRSANAAGAKTEPAKIKPSSDQTATKTVASPTHAGEAAPPAKIAESVGDGDAVRGTAPTSIPSPRPVMPGMGASPPVAAESVNKAGHTAAAGAPVPASATAAPAQPPATGSATSAASGKAAPAKPKTPAGEGAVAKALPATKSTAAARPLPATWIAGSVLVLGAALFFLVRFFSSNDEKPVSTRATDSTMGASIGGPATVTPPTAEQNSAATPAGAPSADSATPTTVGAGPAPSDSPAAAPLPATGAPTAAELADRTGGAQPKPTTPPTTVTVSSAKPPRHKAPHVAAPRDVPREAAALAGEPMAAAESKPVESPPTVAAPAASAAAKTDVAVGSSGPPSTPPADPTADAHQIRVTSKPVGADVVLDGIAVGKTPFTIGIADVNAPHAIAIRKDGFEPFEEMISASSGWIKGPKTSQGKPGTQVLKINAKLKQIGGATAGSGDGKLMAPPTSADPGGVGAKNEQRPLPSPADERTPAEPTTPP